MIASKFKKLTKSILVMLPFILYSVPSCAADGEDYDYKFASTPFEYASLSSPGIKSNLFFLVDNSTFAVPLESQAIIASIVTDPYMIANTRVGLAYLYADTHPFITAEIPTAFLICLVGRGAPVIIPAIAAAILATGAEGGGAIVLAIPSILGILATQMTMLLPMCINDINGSRLIPNLVINSHSLTQEVKLDDLSNNLTAVITSLTASSANSVIPVGLPTLTRRYYEITREIRGLEPNNSFLKRQPSDNIFTDGHNIITRLKNILGVIPGFGLIASPVLMALDYLTSMIGGVPEYKPLFTNAMQYRCQPNFVIVLSPSVVAPGAIRVDGKLIRALRSFFSGTIMRLISSINVSRFIPKVDLNALTVPDDDTLVRKYIYTKNSNNLDFNRWNNSLNHYSDDGLAFLSTLFDETDLKTDRDGTDAEGKSWDNKDFPFQNITTITINTGASNKNGILNVLVSGLNNAVANPNYLKNAASYLVRIGKNGYFKGLSSAEEVKKAVKEAITGINVQKLSNSASTILSQMKPYQGVSAYLDTNNWSSNLRFYHLNNSKNQNDFTVNLNDYASPNYGNITNNSENGIMAHDLNARRVIISTGEDRPQFLKGDTAFKQWLLRPSNESDNQINRRFRTELRDRCFNKNSNCPERMLGDILNVPVLAIDDNPTSRNRSNDPYATFVVTAANDGMVHIFKKTGSNNHPYTMVLDYLPASAKRGNATTIWQQLPNMAHAGYGKNKQHPHQYFNNGGIAYMGTMKKNCAATQEDFTCQSTPAQLFMVGSYGQGGRGLYALNLGGKGYQSDSPIALSNNNQADWLQEIPLWESGSDKYGATDLTSRKAHLSLGYIIGAPILANVALERTKNNELNQMKPTNNGQVRYAVITHNGLFSDDKNPSLYIFDALGITKQEKVETDGTKSANAHENTAQRGQLIAKISTNSSSNSGERQGLSAPAVVDVDNDGIADIVYAGDYSGNLYRFDLRKEKPEQWTVTKIYQSSGSNSSRPDQPITTAPVVYRLDGTGSKYVVMFGTGSDIFEDDLLKNNNKHSIDTRSQSIYGIYDDINDKSPSVVTRHHLLKQSMSKSSGHFKSESKTIIMLSDNKMSSKYKGWYIDLTNDTGERIVRPGKLTGNTVFFTTRVYKNNNSATIHYSTNSCTNAITQNSNGYLIGINPRNGGHLKRSIMNLNPVIDRYKQDAIFISGFQFNGVPSELAFITLGQDGLTDRSGQFNSGWEDAGITKTKQYDEGSLVVTSTANEYYVISVEEPNYIRVRKLNSRELF